MKRSRKLKTTEPDPYAVPFFHDFMLFLTRLSKQPVKQTATGAISLTDIRSLLPVFKQQETIKQFKEYGWHLRREEELEFLTQIKIISELMHLIYKRKGYLHLSKNGKGFLNNLDPLDQYTNMVMYYWYRVNWGYFSHGLRINDLNLAERLQQVQYHIWEALLSNGVNWQNYKSFCISLKEYFKLGPYFARDLDIEYDMMFEINMALFRRNLIRLGCVEIVEKSFKYDWHLEIVKFRPTKLGLHVLSKALYENYL